MVWANSPFSLFLSFFSQKQEPAALTAFEVWKESQTTAFAHTHTRKAAAFAAAVFVGESWGQVRMAVHEFTSGNIETLK